MVLKNWFRIVGIRNGSITQRIYMERKKREEKNEQIKN